MTKIWLRSSDIAGTDLRSYYLQLDYATIFMTPTDHHLCDTGSTCASLVRSSPQPLWKLTGIRIHRSARRSLVCREAERSQKIVPSHSCLFMHASPRPLTNRGFGHQWSVEMAAPRPIHGRTVIPRAVYAQPQLEWKDASCCGALGGRAGMRHCISVICQMPPMPGLLVNAFIHSWKCFLARIFLEN